MVLKWHGAYYKLNDFLVKKKKELFLLENISHNAKKLLNRVMLHFKTFFQNTKKW